MPLPYDKSAAVVVLPSLAGDRVSDPGLRRWLSRASVKQHEQPRELLQRVLECLRLPYPGEGLAAMRMWGQTGDRPSVWIAAADPVCLEAGLSSVRLHALHVERMPDGDLREIIDYLQQRLADEDRYGFVIIGTHAYMRSSEPFATAREPARVIDQQEPSEFLPAGREAASHHTLRSEVEMALHEHPVNQRRESLGLPPVNSLWLWGGGFAPEQITEPRPPLFTDDALLKGYWLSKTALVEDWPGSIAACLDEAVAGFVATPAAGRYHLNEVLQELRAALRSGRISRITLLIEDGYTLELNRSDRWRFWRRNTQVFGSPA